DFTSLDRKIYVLRDVTDDFCYSACIELCDYNSYDVTVLVKQRASRVSSLNRRTYLDFARIIPDACHMPVTIGRREVIAALGAAAAWPLAARAQQPKTLRVGFVGMQPRESPLYANFLKRMAELGYQEGRNFTFDYIQTPNIEGYEKNYRELATRNVDVFLAVGNEPVLRAALSVADGKPIAFLAVDFDPLAKGYVANLSHPSNVTGIFVREIELAAKRVEIAREAFPHATLVGIAFDTL